MKRIDQMYVNGQFVTPHGTETFDLISPVTNTKTGEVVLGDETDARLAIAAAKEAFKTFRKTTVEERIVYLQQLYDAVSKREDELVKVMVGEYGASCNFAKRA